MKSTSPLSFKNISLGFGGLVLSAFTFYNLVTNVTKANAAAPCIITLFGVQYDVAPLQPTGAHPGGNIFVCGTDMTTVYQGMHGTDVSRMVPYLYTPATPTPTVVPTVIPTTTPSPSVAPTATPTVAPEVTPTPTVAPQVTPTVAPQVTPTPTLSPGHHEDNDDNESENESDRDNDSDNHSDDHDSKENKWIRHNVASFIWHDHNDGHSNRLNENSNRF
jgi:hypothetical protein